MSYDITPNEDLKPELQKYIGIFTNSQKILKECSMQRGLNWLSDSQQPALVELAITLESNPKQLCAVLDCLGILIDLNIIHEFMNSNKKQFGT